LFDTDTCLFQADSLSGPALAELAGLYVDRVKTDTGLTAK